MSKKVEFFLTLGVLGLLGLWGLGSIITISLSQSDLVGSWSKEAAINGTWTKEAENQFDESLLFRTPILNLWNRGLFILFRQGLPGVLVGQEGWLYTEEEWYTEPEGSQEAWEFIAQTQRTLKNQNIRLVLVVVPSKNRVANEYSPRPLPSSLGDRYAQSLRKLEVMEITSLDLESAFLRPTNPSVVFLKTDTHWTPEGARLAALEIATIISLEFPDRNLGGWTFETNPGESEPFRGDLFEFLPQGNGLTPDLVRSYRTTQTQGPSLGLFDLPRIPVALVGTSYSAGERWNFLGFLQEALGSDIVSFAQEGKGPFVPMKEALENPGLQEAGVELIIWEIPERYLPN